MNESNCKAFKLQWSIKECILRVVAMRMSVRFCGILQINFYLFPNHVILKPAMAFTREEKKKACRGQILGNDII